MLCILFFGLYSFNVWSLWLPNLSNFGLSKYDSQDYKGAIADFTKAIELDPNDSEAYNNRGLSKADLQDYKGAIVDYSKATDGYTLWYYNTKKKLITFEGFNSMMAQDIDDRTEDNDDLLFNLASKTAFLEKMRMDVSDWIKKNGIEVEEINCDHFIFQKILMGDKSDNIKPVISWNKGGRTYGISQKHADKILEQYLKEEKEFIIDHMFSEEQIEKIADIAYRVVGNSSKSQIKTRFNQNLDIMLLHHHTIPEPIQKQMQEAIDKDSIIEPEINKIL